MAIKITKSNELIEVKNICFTIYSQPGLGKTSLAFTASRPLLLDFDRGSYRAADRGDVVQVETWADVAGLSADDLDGYDTIVVDTVGKALDFLSQDILKGNQRLGYGGALNQQGWGQLGVKFKAFLNMLKGFGKDVILISHMDESKDGDQIKERLKIQGGSKDLILTDSDVIARISVFNKARHLMFSPTETSFGKDPASIGVVEIPDAAKPEFHDYLTTTITNIKTGLNSLSEAQIERKSEVEWFKEHLPEMRDADAINAVLNRAKKVGKDVAKMVVDRAVDLGLEFDPTKREYVYLEEMNPDDNGDQPSGLVQPNSDEEAA